MLQYSFYCISNKNFNDNPPFINVSSFNMVFLIFPLNYTYEILIELNIILYYAKNI